MNFNLTDTKKIERLERELSGLEQRLNAVLIRIESYSAEIGLYRSTAWEDVFVEKILKPESDRLAHKRMSLPVEKTDDHISISGQYAEVQLLINRREIVEKQYEEDLVEKNEIENRIAEIKNKIQREKGRV